MMKMAAAMAAAVCHCNAAPSVPSTMMAVKKRGIFPCNAPFNCVETFTTKVPTPGPGQLLIKVAGSSVNPCDVDFLETGVGCSGGGGILGMDAAGTVVSLGANPSGRFAVGDTVWTDIAGGRGTTGGMAEYAVLDDANTGLAPSTLNATAAGTIPLAALTSIEMFERVWAAYAGSRSNLTVVVTEGTGGTGFIALQLAKHVYNATRVVTATSGATDIALAKSLGADVVVDYKVADIFSTLPVDSVDVVIDNYGARGTADKAMPSIRPGGVYLVLPGGGGGTISKNPKQGVKQIDFGFTSSGDHANLDALRSMFDAGHLRAVLYAQVPLADAKTAFQLSKSGVVAGKVAVVPPMTKH